MKIKSKKPTKPAKKSYGGYKKYDIGGGSNVPGVNDNTWNNLPTSGTDSGTTTAPKKGGQLAQASGYASMAAGALSPLWAGQDTSNIATRQDSAVAPKVFGGIKEVAKQIPVIGGFVQAGDTLGKGFEAGINKANEKKGSNRDVGASFAAFGQGLADPIAEHQKIWQLQKNKKIGTGEAVGWSALNFLGGAGIANAVLEKKNKKDLHPGLDQVQQMPAATPLDQDPTIAQFADGGFGDKTVEAKSHLLEKYKLNKHSQLNPNFANFFSFTA